MIKLLCRKIAAISLVVFGVWCGASNVKAQAISEGFETVPPAGWTIQNNSVPIGNAGWQQGNSAIFPAHQGLPNSYAMANSNATTGTGTISSWLISPQRTFSNGDVIRFWTRTKTASPFPDRMQVRLSLAGASTDTGTSATTTGVFTRLLLDINPTYETGGVYPEAWTQFTLTLSGLAAPTSGRVAFRYFVEMGGPTGGNSNAIGVDTFSYASFNEPPFGDAPIDFNGDGKTDYAVIRNVGGGINGQVRWYWNINGTVTNQALDWGLASDLFISEDFDGDDKDDIAIWRPGAPTVAAFYILQSQTNTFRIEPFGQTGDDPSVVDDYNGDNKADLAVYRAGANSGAASTWYYRTTPGGAVAFVSWGVGGDFPVPGDFDGNGSADFSVQRVTGGAGQFWTRLSNGTIQSAVAYGLNDVVVPGDYDGDGKTDYAVVRAIGGALVWYWRPSGGGADQQVVFGLSTDFPAQGDYDGDGKTDVAIYRTSTTAGQSAFWTRSTTSGAVSTFVFGINGDYPMANFNTH